MGIVILLQYAWKFLYGFSSVISSEVVTESFEDKKK